MSFSRPIHLYHSHACRSNLAGDGSFNQGCELRKQKNSTCTRPSFREIWKVSSLSPSLSLSLSGKKGSPWPSPRSSFPRPPHAENEPSIAVEGSRPPPPCSAYGTPTKLQVSKRKVLKRQVYKTSGLQNKYNKSLFTLTHNYTEYTIQ